MDAFRSPRAHPLRPERYSTRMLQSNHNPDCKRNRARNSPRNLVVKATQKQRSAACLLEKASRLTTNAYHARQLGKLAEAASAAAAALQVVAHEGR